MQFHRHCGTVYGARPVVSPRVPPFMLSARCVPDPVPPRKETYGDSERILGSWLQKDPARRAKVVIASKVASRSPGPRLAHIVGSRQYPPDAPEQPELALSRTQILAACEGSLQRLGTDYIDLYQLHWPDRYSNLFDRREYSLAEERAVFTPFEESVKAIGELLAAGKIKQWGVSNENAVGICKFMEACEKNNVQKPVTIQNDFSCIHRKFEEDGTAEACSKLHCGVDGGIKVRDAAADSRCPPPPAHARPTRAQLLAYGALAGGTLSGKYERDADGNLTTKSKRSRHVLFPNFQPRWEPGWRPGAGRGLRPASRTCWRARFLAGTTARRASKRPSASPTWLPSTAFLRRPLRSSGPGAGTIWDRSSSEPRASSSSRKTSLSSTCPSLLRRSSRRWTKRAR